MSTLKSFSVSPIKPTLVGGVGQGGPIDELVRRFGDHWKKTPAIFCWCLESPGLQFTIIPLSDQWDIAAYPYETVAEFRKAFEDKTHVANAVYFQTIPTDKYTGLAVIRYMQQNGYM